MNDRIDLATRSPLAAARLCQESPNDLLDAMDEFRALSPDNQRRVRALLENADSDFGCRVVGLVRHDGFQASDAAHQEVLLDTLAGRRDADTLGQLQELARDAEFRRMPPREARSEAHEVVEGNAFPDVTEMIRGSGARAHEGHSFSIAGAVELAAHAFEIVADIAVEHAAMAGLIGAGSAAGAVVAGAAPAVACVVAVSAGLYGLAHDHREGASWGEAVSEGCGFVDQMAHHLRGDDAVGGGGPRARGAAAADRFWDNLSPAQRVELRTMGGQDRLLRALAMSMESITIAGHGRAE